MPTSEKIFTKEFLALNGVIFLVFCNVAVFFQFQNYLQGELGLPPNSLGFLIGIFAFTAIVVRPIVSPFLHSDNARKWLLVSTAGVIVSLMLYYPARDFWSLTVVRVIHGATYVILATAAMTKLMDFIPEKKSGQAFGLITIITLLPYAIMPPLLDPLIGFMGGFLPVLYVTAFLMVLIFPLLLVIKAKNKGEDDQVQEGITRQAFLNNLKDKQIFFLLFISLLLYTAFAPVFFYLKGYALNLGIANPGWFFTLSTFMEITVRLLGGPWLDKGNKAFPLVCALVGLVTAYIFLAHTTGIKIFYGLGLGFGLCWGIAMPLLNGLIFDKSPPRFRAINTNLAMVMFQGGLFLGPLLGGWLLSQWNYRVLYYACGAMILAGLGLLALIRKELLTPPGHSPRPAR